MHKTVPQVYRDCLRLIDHLAGRSRKGDHMRTLVARQFRKHADVKDLDRIEVLKRNAMSGLANYLTMESLGKLEAQNGASTGRDPQRLAAAVRKSLGRDAAPEGEADQSPSFDAAAAIAEENTISATAAAAAKSSGSSTASAASVARADAAARAALRNSIPEADVTPVVSDRIAELQAQLRANKNFRLELEKRAREGKPLVTPAAGQQ